MFIKKKRHCIIPTHDKLFLFGNIPHYIIHTSLQYMSFVVHFKWSGFWKIKMLILNLSTTWKLFEDFYISYYSDIDYIIIWYVHLIKWMKQGVTVLTKDTQKP